MASSSDELGATLSDKVKEAITTALKARYISISSHMDYQTGNAYQAIALGDESVDGYRHDRSRLFSVFNLKGRRVLDCGCNLGELSRLARGRDAALVDGIEYDRYLVQIARLINAYQGTTRVSIFQGDLTDGTAIRDTYDVSMAFSVFPYILPILDKLAAATGEALILETHDVTPKLRSVYVEPLIKHFPHYTFVDFTDFGRGEGLRAVFVFAKKRSTLLADGLLRSSVDVIGSQFRFVEPILALCRRVIGARNCTPADFPEIVESSAARDAQDEARLTAGCAYWLDMMRGYLQAKRENRVTADNVYVNFLRRCLRELKFDPVLEDRLASDEAIVDRVASRFRDIDLLASGPQDFGAIEPITVFNPTASDGKLAIVHGETGKTVYADLIDGYHRVLWASLFGVKRLPALYTLQ